MLGGKKESNRQELADAGACCASTHVHLVLSVLLYWIKMSERSGVDHRAPTTQQSSLFPSIPSILHPSFCPQQSLSSSLFISCLLWLLPSFPPSVTFHVVTHYSTDISPSMPLHVSNNFSPTGVGLHPRVSAWTGLGGEDGGWVGGCVPDGQTLNSRREGKDGRMKEEEERKGQDPGVWSENWKRPKRN